MTSNQLDKISAILNDSGYKTAVRDQKLVILADVVSALAISNALKGHGQENKLFIADTNKFFLTFN